MADAGRLTSNKQRYGTRQFSWQISRKSVGSSLNMLKVSCLKKSGGEPPVGWEGIKDRKYNRLLLVVKLIVNLTNDNSWFKNVTEVIQRQI